VSTKTPRNIRPAKKNDEPKFEITGWILAIVAGFLLLCAVLPMILGPISGAITSFLWGVFGFSIYPILVCAVAGGIFLIKGYKLSVPKMYVFCIAATALILIFMLHLATTLSLINEGLSFSQYASRVFAGPSVGGVLSAGGVFFGTLVFGIQASITPVASFILYGLGIVALTFVMLNHKFSIFSTLRKRNIAQDEPMRRDTFIKNNRTSAPVAPTQDRGLFVDTIIAREQPAAHVYTNEAMASTSTHIPHIVAPPIQSAPYQSESGDFSTLKEREVATTAATYSTALTPSTASTSATALTSAFVETPLQAPSLNKEKQTAYDILFGDRDKLLGRNQPVSSVESLYAKSPSSASSYTNQNTSTSRITDSVVTPATKPPKIIHGFNAKEYGLQPINDFPSKEIEVPLGISGEIINGAEESLRLERSKIPASPASLKPVQSPIVKQHTETVRAHGHIDPRNYDSIFHQYDAGGRQKVNAYAGESGASASESVEFVDMGEASVAPATEPIVFEEKYAVSTEKINTSIFEEKPTLFKKRESAFNPTPIVDDFGLGKSFTESLNEEPSAEFERFKKTWDESTSLQDSAEEMRIDTNVAQGSTLDDKYRGFATEGFYVAPSASGASFEETDQQKDSFSDLSHVENIEKSQTLDLSETHATSVGDHSGYREEVKDPESYQDLQLESAPKLPEITFVSLKERKKIAQNQVQMESYMANAAQEPPKTALKKKRKKYMAPPIELLAHSRNVILEDAEADVNERADLLVKTLKDLKLDVKVSEIVRGPSVTRYELVMPPGIPIKTIKQYVTDIEYYLASNGKIRLETPVPGKRAVGIEVPNVKKDVVSLREVIESKEFKKAESPLAFALGKDITGSKIICEVDKTPHLLIAGATGSGKSVCLNSILLSIAYKASPEDVRLILVDPKRVEFTVYKGMPHLLSDIICDDKQALNAFKWLRAEMERRYLMFSRNIVRNIGEFNASRAVAEGEEEKLPYIVLIVDELADLMSSNCKKELEENIMSIAQKARAAGIHLILATQRPSVDVITGTIKANLPSRIAFSLKSVVDSRTILDAQGAETLLGKGDMLYAPQGVDDPRRVQGAWVTSEEVASVVDYVNAHNETDFDEEVVKAIAHEEPPAGMASALSEAEDLGYDPLLPDILKSVIEMGTASTSFIQRRFAMGYARAARISDYMEAQGFIGPSEGSKPRSVYITWEKYKELFDSE